MENKRKFIRFDAPLYVKYNVSDDVRQFQGVAQNISMGGAKMTVDQDFKVKSQDKLDLYFLLPEKTLAVAAQVAWVSNSEQAKEVGIMFQEFPDACKEELYQHIFKYHRHEITQKWWQF